ncbi:acetyltransferase [Hydrogenophaga sp. 5NK40-0174]
MGHRTYRALWRLCWALFAAWTPAPLHRWRNGWLRLFGAEVHPTARVYGSARIWYPRNLSLHAHTTIGPGATLYCMGHMEIGEKSVISQGAHLCGGTHDIRSPDFQLQVRPVVIGQHAWVAAEAFIGPGVTVGDGAVIGARAVLMRDAERATVYAGNPAQRIKHVPERARFQGEAA